ncbi:hypothetical protein JIN85_03475 [Luteolibacter pohnpeiensis]|uniref:Uncharacterized protein n=1 Tax=Luteolibacter pohnpeiensis TaxID=454153 RepID=A0A934S569_9BACT|nr:hypothetical protein [Luteolibacter pohnpeiensis]MBK1881460.1 hypothetical protein [Luteolibacter pohnpeiensis]
MSKTTSVPYSFLGTSPVEAAWERFKKRLDTMTKEEKLQTFVDAGILTKKGNPTKPYKGVFVKAKATK